MTSKVKGQGRDASDRCWFISRQRKVTKPPKVVRRLTTTRTIMKSSRNTKIGSKVAIMHTSFKVKRSKIKVTRPITVETESVSYLPNVDGTPMEHALSTATAMKASEVEFLHAGGGMPCRPHPAAIQLAWIHNSRTQSHKQLKFDACTHFQRHASTRCIKPIFRDEIYARAP